MNGLDNFKYANISLYVKMSCKAHRRDKLDKKNEKYRLYYANSCTSYSQFHSKYICTI